MTFLIMLIVLAIVAVLLNQFRRWWLVQVGLPGLDPASLSPSFIKANRETATNETSNISSDSSDRDTDDELKEGAAEVGNRRLRGRPPGSKKKPTLPIFAPLPKGEPPSDLLFASSEDSNPYRQYPYRRYPYRPSLKEGRSKLTFEEFAGHIKSEKGVGLKFQDENAESSITAPKLEKLEAQSSITDWDWDSFQVLTTMPDFETAVDEKIRSRNSSSWELFCEDVGEVAYSSSLQPLAVELVNKCCDNAHAIRIMAAALKDVSDVDVWRTALEMLGMGLQSTSNKESKENLMVNVVKFSYQRLQDDKTRKCLRNCAFLCNNELIAIELLVQSCLMDGLIVSYDEGKKMLITFINLNLLESLEDEDDVKMQKKICYILLEHIIPLETGQSFLGQGSMGLTKPPKVEEWVKCKEIYLMDNQLFELPLNPVCPKLEALFLGRNNKLRMISPSFFDHMPALQVLNLSRTSIKSLPESLFKLVNLRRLFLNHCDYITTLSPKVGELKLLEVLDLAGTDIMYLPLEVGQLTKLKCLEVSFFEPTSQKRSGKIIPNGVISALSLLQELNFDVSPNDKRWSACSEVIVAEISELQNLYMLKYYFPSVELLSHFNCLEDAKMTTSSLSHFRFIVGHFVERVISRVLHDTELELERYDKYLKYVNGEGIPEDIKKVLRYANAFFLDRHSTISKLSDFGYANMRELKCCVAGQCNELQAIIDGNQIENESSSDAIVGFESLEYLHIYYMKNLRSICEGPVNNHSFCMLKYLTLRTCPELTTIFTPEFLVSFSNLEELTIHDCPKLTSLVSCCSFEDKISCIILPALKRISLHFLPKLTSISNGLAISPELELMSFRYCLNLKRLPISKDFNKNLRKIKGESSWWRGLEWEITLQESWDDVFVPID